MRIATPDVSDFGQNGHFAADPEVGGIQPDHRPTRVRHLLFPHFGFASPGNYSAGISTSYVSDFGQDGHLELSPTVCGIRPYPPTASRLTPFSYPFYVFAAVGKVFCALHRIRRFIIRLKRTFRRSFVGGRGSSRSPTASFACVIYFFIPPRPPGKFYLRTITCCESDFGKSAILSYRRMMGECHPISDQI